MQIAQVVPTSGRALCERPFSSLGQGPRQRRDLRNNGPLGNGWGIDGVDQLIPVAFTGMILLHGNGDYELFGEYDDGGSLFQPTR